MKKESFYIIGLILIAMNILLASDFFPNLLTHVVIPKLLILFIMLILVATSIFYSRLKIDDSTETLTWQIVSTCYLLLLIILFTMLGGTSQVGISLENSVLWTVVVISLIEIYQQKKKLKSENATVKG